MAFDPKDEFNPFRDDPNKGATGGEFNPFASPQSFDKAQKSKYEYTGEPEPICACPSCGGGKAEPAPYDWFRGRRAPVATQHVLCPDCRCEYNGETGIAYRPAKSPLFLFVVAIVLAALYFLFHIVLICGGFF